MQKSAAAGATFSVVEFVSLIFGLAVLSAFALMPWTTMHDMSLSGAALYGEEAVESLEDVELPGVIPVDAEDVTDTYSTSLLLIVVAAVVGPLGAVWGIVDAYNRRQAALLTLLAGAAGLLYYVFFFLLNAENDVDMVGFAGAGFWVALIGALWLALQIALPRPAVDAQPLPFMRIFTEMRRNIYPYLLIAPALFLMVSISLYPTIYSFYLSLTRVSRGDLRFVGFENFELIFTSGDFWESLQLTLIFGVFYIALTVLFAFILALMFNRGLRFGGFYMMMVFVPWVLSEITSGVVWRWMFYRDYGILQNLLGPIFGDVTLMADKIGAMGIVTGASVWRSVAFAMLLILAGLQTIPKAVYEAAAIDGANRWQSFWEITWPLIKPTTIVTVVYLSIQAVNAIGMFLAITDGGPGRATEVLSLHMYREALQYFHFGYGAALSVIMFGLNVILAALYMRALRSDNPMADY